MNDWSIAVVTSGMPRRSETFALNELAALADAGRLAAVFATKAGDSGMQQPQFERIASHVEMLAAGTPAEQAIEVAQRLAQRPVAGVHGYFAHQPALVAELAATRLGVRFGFSCHARDVRKVPAVELARRVRRARRVITCNHDTLAALGPNAAAAALVAHGVDPTRFRATPADDAPALRLLAVGRLVPKKGFDVLLQALARTHHAVTLRLVGSGPEAPRLERLAGALGIASRLEMIGAVTHHDLPDLYAWSHAVVVPSIIDPSGDRDGLPNVVLEAMASGRAVVASRVSAIPSAVRHERTGLLVEPADATMLARAIDRLAAGRLVVRRLGVAGRRLVEEQYTLERCTARLLSVLGETYG
jgi:glycosyltransferase involved in cell wall biosynthesis